MVANVTPWISFQDAADVPALGGAAWASPQNARVQDGVVASAGPIGLKGEASATNVLRLLNTLTAHIPQAPFTLLGVEVEVRGRWSGADATGALAVASHVDGTVRQSLGNGSLPLSAFGVLVRGGPTNTLGLAAADLSDPEFGFQLSASTTFLSTGAATLEIDSVRWRCHWDQIQAPNPRARKRDRRSWANGHLAGEAA